MRRLLDFLQLVQQLQGIEQRVQSQAAVQKVSLLHAAEGLRLNEVRYLANAAVRQGAMLHFFCQLKMLRQRLQIRPDHARHLVPLSFLRA